MIYKNLSLSMTHGEKVCGWLYFAFELLLMPYVLGILCGLLPFTLTAAQLNLVFFTVNFLAISLIFRKFLAKSFQKSTKDFWPFLRAAVFGLAGYYALGYLTEDLAHLLNPGFRNANDSAVVAMAASMRIPMLIATTMLVPLAEECLFRGLIFRSLYNKSRFSAFCISTLAFAAVHITGFLDSYTLRDALCALLQYLPAGVCLGWAYAASDTIAAPIAVHAIINAVALFSVR